MALSSAHSMVWEYSAMLRRHVEAARHAPDDAECRQEVALCVLLAVALVETFVNALFRLLVEQPEFEVHRPWVLEDLKRRRSLEYKLDAWPRNVLGTPIDFSCSMPKLFRDVKERRNRLMHFSGAFEQVELPGVVLKTLVDTSAFDSLTADDAVEAQSAARGLMEHLLRLRGIPENELPYVMQGWTGIVAR